MMPLAYCTRYKEKVRNTRIKSRIIYSPSGKRKKDFQLTDGPFFDSICSLVEHYKTNPYKNSVSLSMYAVLLLFIRFITNVNNFSTRILKFVLTNPFLIFAPTWAKTGSTQILDKRKQSSYFSRFRNAVPF